MITTIYAEPIQEANNVLSLVKAAVDAEVAQLTLALEMAGKRLAPFEQKYHISSDKFIVQLTADDLEGGDDEYIVWAGEYQLKQRLQKKLQQLQAIQYGHPEVLQ
jgi:hypothetical protein